MQLEHGRVVEIPGQGRVGVPDAGHGFAGVADCVVDQGKLGLGVDKLQHGVEGIWLGVHPGVECGLGDGGVSPSNV